MLTYVNIVLAYVKVILTDVNGLLTCINVLLIYEIFCTRPGPTDWFWPSKLYQSKILTLLYQTHMHDEEIDK